MPTKPLISSSVLLRGLATAVTISSAASMTAFASTHLQNSAAPLQPSAPATTTSFAAPTPTPVATAATRRRTTVTSGVTTTTTTAVTKTHRS